jgi:hypothetical protein
LDVEKPDQPQGPSTDSKANEDIQLSAIQLQTKNFNEKLRKNRFDEKLWIEFVDFQDKVKYL